MDRSDQFRKWIKITESAINNTLPVNTDMDNGCDCGSWKCEICFPVDPEHTTHTKSRSEIVKKRDKLINDIESSRNDIRYDDMIAINEEDIDYSDDQDPSELISAINSIQQMGVSNSDTHYSVMELRLQGYRLS